MADLIIGAVLRPRHRRRLVIPHQNPIKGTPMPISTSRNVTASGGQLTLGDLRAAVTAADGMSDDVVILGESAHSRLYVDPILTKIIIADRPRVSSCDDLGCCYADAVTTVNGRVYCAEHAPAVKS